MKKLLLIFSLSLNLLFSYQINAEPLINYDQLSFFEVPQSYSLGSGTLLFETALELAYQSENDGLAEFDSQQAEAFIWYGTQLNNDWDVGASYRINYDTERSESTVDELRLFAQDQWGFISAGHISTLLYDQSRRQVATGLLGVDQDNFTLALDQYGVFYEWATPDSQWMVAADEESNIEAGIIWSKPIGSVDYKFSIRANNTERQAGDAQSVAKSKGIALVAQITKSRFIVDGQWMTERVLLLDGLTEMDLESFSMGIHAKFDLVTLSLTAINRENELSDTEHSASFGLRYDVSRGLSLNFGANIFSTELISDNFTSYAASLRYQF